MSSSTTVRPSVPVVTVDPTPYELVKIFEKAISGDRIEFLQLFNPYEDHPSKIFRTFLTAIQSKQVLYGFGPNMFDSNSVRNIGGREDLRWIEEEKCMIKERERADICGFSKKFNLYEQNEKKPWVLKQFSSLAEDYKLAQSAVYALSFESEQYLKAKDKLEKANSAMQKATSPVAIQVLQKVPTKPASKKRMTPSSKAGTSKKTPKAKTAIRKSSTTKVGLKGKKTEKLYLSLPLSGEGRTRYQKRMWLLHGGNFENSEGGESGGENGDEEGENSEEEEPSGEPAGENGIEEGEQYGEDYNVCGKFAGGASENKFAGSANSEEGEPSGEPGSENGNAVFEFGESSGAPGAEDYNLEPNVSVWEEDQPSQMVVYSGGEPIRGVGPIVQFEGHELVLYRGNAQFVDGGVGPDNQIDLYRGAGGGGAPDKQIVLYRGAGGGGAPDNQIDLYRGAGGGGAIVLYRGGGPVIQIVLQEKPDSDDDSENELFWDADDDNDSEEELYDVADAGVCIRIVSMMLRGFWRVVGFFI